MRTSLQYLIVGFIITATIQIGSIAFADHWYVPGGDPVSSYSEPYYLQPTQYYSEPVYSQPIYSRPAYVMSVNRVAPTPVIVARPIVVYAEPVYVEPLIVSPRVVVPAPIYNAPVVSGPYKVREEIKSRPGHYEYEQKGKFRVYNEGLRPKTYRYEYEVDHRYGRSKTKFDIRD